MEYNKNEFFKTLDNIGMGNMGKRYYLRLWGKDPQVACSKLFATMEKNMSGDKKYEMFLGKILRKRFAVKSPARPIEKEVPFTWERCRFLYPKWGDSHVEWDEAVAEGRAVLA